MTIGSLIFCIIVSIAIGIGAIALCETFDTVSSRTLIVLIAILLIVGMIFGFRWYYSSTASGRRSLTDEQSELSDGLDRVINVYTANGDLIAHYSGKIDIEDNNGGYVLFDYNGVRYTYYNCFVESIAKIN